MVKSILIPMIYCIGCVIGSFSNNVQEIGSSISLPVAYSASGIENSESFSNDRAKGRALALLVPFDDYDQSGEERHKSKRCWKTPPAQKMRLSFEPDDDTENRVHRESGKPSRRTKCNFNKLYNNEKRSAELSDEGSSEIGRSQEDNSERKFSHLRIVPLKNSRTHLKEFLRSDLETDDDDSTLNDSEENTDDLILRRIKNHLNSDDYKVLALVGKRASNSRSDRRTKYICYCREDNCSGGDCQRMMYRPCSRCRNSRPVFVGKVNSNRCSDGSGNYYRNKEAQFTDARTSLNVRYPAGENEVLESPANENVKLKQTPEISTPTNAGFSGVDLKNVQQNLPLADDRRYQFSYDTPSIVLANPNIIRPMDQYRIVHVPVSAKSPIETGNGLPGSKIPASFYSSAPEKPGANNYRAENFYYPPNRIPYNQWVTNPYYPSIGQARNLEIRNKNHRTGPRTFDEAYQTDNRFIGSKIPYGNQEISVYPQRGTPGSMISKNSDTAQPKMPTNFNNAFYHYLHDGSGVGWNTHDGMKAQAYSQQQNIPALTENPDYPKNPKLPSMHTSADLSYGAKNQMLKNSEEENSQFKSVAEDYNVNTENHFDSVLNLETDSNDHSNEFQEDNPKDLDHEDSTEQPIMNSEASVGNNLLHSKDRETVNSPEVNEESEEYEIAANSSDEVNSPEADRFSDTLGSYENLDSGNGQIRSGYGRYTTEETQELNNNRNSIISAIGTDHAITGTEISNYDDQTGDTVRESTFSTQLEEPANGRSNWNQDNVDTTSQAIIRTESNEDGYSMSSESQEDVESTVAKPEYSDVEESGRVLTSEETQPHESSTDDYSDIVVITNGYFTSRAYDDFEMNNNETIPATETTSGSDLMQHEHDTHDTTTLHNSEQIEFQLENKNVAESVDKVATVDHVENREYSSSSIHQSEHENLDKKLEAPNNQLLKIDDEEEDAFVGSVESREPNTVCTCTKSKDSMKKLSEPEKSSSEVVGKQETAFLEYEPATSDAGDNHKADSLTGKGSQTPDEEVGKKAAEDLLSVSTDGKKSEESYEDVSYSDSRSMEYSAEDIPAVFSQKNSASPADDLVETQNDGNLREHERNFYYHQAEDKPADFMIDNVPTRYFSPNDRVLDYFKKHSQNLVGSFDPANYEQPNTQALPIHPIASVRGSQYVTPTIYHTEIDQDESTEPDYQGFHSGIESEEIITRPKEGSDWRDLRSGNSHESIDSDVTASQEISSRADESSIEAPRYGEQNYIQFSNCGGDNVERQTVILNTPGGDYTNGKSVELQKPVDESDIIKPGQILTANFTPEGNIGAPASDYHDELFPRVETDQDDQIYHDNISGDYAEEFLRSDESKSGEESGSTLQQERPSAGNEIEKNSDAKKLISDEAISPADARATEITGSYRNDVEKIHHLIKSDEKTYGLSTNHRSGDIYPIEDHSLTKPIEESVPTQAPFDVSSADYSYSAESTEGSILVGKSQEQDVRSGNEKSEIIHIHNGFSSDIYDYQESTEESRSAEESIKFSRDYSAENLSGKWGNAGSARKTTLPCSSQVIVQKSMKESYDIDKKHLLSEFVNSSSERDVKTNAEDIQNEFRSSNGKVSDSGSEKEQMLDHSQMIHHENSWTESKSGIENFERTTLDQHVAIENHTTQSTTQNSERDHVADQPELFLQRPVVSMEEDDLDVNDDGDEEYDPDTPRRSKAQDGSHSENGSRKESSGAEDVELMIGSQSSGCCTKPPEVQDDPGYLGRLKPKKSNTDVNSLGDLVDSDLFYIGDGVKLPLTVKKLKDGSFALSISDLICEKRLKEKCPCCVPRKGKILQESRAEEDAEELSTTENNHSSLHRRAIPDEKQSEITRIGLVKGKARVDDERAEKMKNPVLNEDEKTQDPVRRVTRSVSMPVEEFAEKYNLILDLKDQLVYDLGDVKAADSSLKHNLIQRDEETDDAEQHFVQKLELIHKVPEDGDVLLSTIQDLIPPEPEKRFRTADGLKTKMQLLKSVENYREDGQEARYDYQKHNPILERIRMIKRLQQDANKCEHKYQKDCDDAVTQKTELLIMILRWLRSLVGSEPNRSKNT